MTKKLSKNSKHVKLPRSVKRLFPQVETCLDGEKPVEISVTAADCKSGKKKDPAECALARAARRELRADAVIIGMSTSYLIKNKVAIRFQTPESVSREIVSFDRNQDFAPGDYYLTPKPPASRLGKQKWSSKSGSGPNNKTAKRKVHKSARVRILAKGAE